MPPPTDLRMLERDAARDQPLGASPSVGWAAWHARGNPDGEERNEDHDPEHDPMAGSTPALRSRATGHDRPPDATTAVPSLNMSWTRGANPPDRPYVQLTSRQRRLRRHAEAATSTCAAHRRACWAGHEFRMTIPRDERRPIVPSARLTRGGGTRLHPTPGTGHAPATARARRTIPPAPRPRERPDASVPKTHAVRRRCHTAGRPGAGARPWTGAAGRRRQPSPPQRDDRHVSEPT